ncbi:leucine-rich repeat-containing protein [Chrysochromulina tobinii]|uniref:Leucine-rich repeat-containing protein n=1 Tax=Chrysochromulina tobinii TaxID=1460289 RepID=A0A0M0JQ59_9EUKA|nr:leucine-rich repeat-containing protein [Chrysochromulina tobinii]|eukprot:KOO28731.1 leucine-rich repeat-containing protein [Chrysochromulina sp. CCMP291]
MPRREFKALGAHSIATAAGCTVEKAQQALSYLTERGDEALFACSGTKLASGTDRLVLVSRYRLVLVRWKPLGLGVAFKDLHLLELRGMTCQGDMGAWGFGEGATVQIKSPRLQDAAHATLHAYGSITLCLDVPPLALSLPREWKSIGFDMDDKVIDMGFSRTWLAVHSYSVDPASGRSGAAPSPSDAKARRERLAAFMAQLISRPARRDRILDLTFIAELTAADFAAAAVALRHTSMFAGVRLLDAPIGEAISALSECARTSKSLTVVHLSGVLTAAPSDVRARLAAKSFVDALSEGAAARTLPLTDLDLSGNELRDGGVTAISQLVQALRQGLRLLDISDAKASSRGMQPLIAALCEGRRSPQGVMHASSALEILRLADNEIGPRGTPLLAQMLQRAAKLEELDLRSTGVAAKLVVETLQKGTAGATLRILDLSGNKLSRADLAALFHFLGGCTALVELSLARCTLAPESLVALLQAAQLNRGLNALTLDASSNPFGALGGQLLSTALPHCTKLSGLYIDACHGATAAKGDDTALSVVVCEALTKSAPQLTCLGLGRNAAPRSGDRQKLIAGLATVLGAAPRLHTLLLAGSPALRLKLELASVLGCIASCVAPIQVLDVSGHHAGDGLLEALPALLAGPKAPACLLLHENLLTATGLEQLAGLMGAAETHPTEVLVVTHEDAHFALTHEVEKLKRPWESAAKRVQSATVQIQQAVAVGRARRRLYPRMRHPRPIDGVPYVMKWPNWAELLHQAAPGSPAGAGMQQSWEPPPTPLSEYGNSPTPRDGVDEDEAEGVHDPAFEAALADPFGGFGSPAMGMTSFGFGASGGSSFTPSFDGNGFGTSIAFTSSFDGNGFGTSFGGNDLGATPTAGSSSFMDGNVPVFSGGFSSGGGNGSFDTSQGFGTSFADAQGFSGGLGEANFSASNGFGVAYGDGSNSSAVAESTPPRTMSCPLVSQESTTRTTSPTLARLPL